MSDWWWYVVVAVVVLVVAGFLYMRRRDTGAGSGAAVDPSRHYGEEREVSRLGDMSEEDRAWESASLERSRKAEASKPPPPERD